MHRKDIRVLCEPDARAGRPRSFKRLSLIGFKASGKSCIGKALALRLNCPFIDIDTLLEKKHKLTCRQLYQQHGETQFRLLEKEALHSLHAFERGVIATGGGTVLDSQSAQWLEAHSRVIFLKCPQTVLWQRWQRAGLPPFCTSFQEFLKIYHIRLPIYRQMAHATYFCRDGQTPDEIAADILNGEQ